MAKHKPTRRFVIGSVASHLDRIAAVWPRNHDTLVARIEGPKVARRLEDLASVLRDLEDYGVEAAAEVLADIDQQAQNDG